MSTKKGGVYVTDTDAINLIIEQSGYKKSWLAKQLGLSPYGLSLKINNRNQFTAEEIQKLCDLLKITSLKEKDKIFFAKQVDK